MERPFSFESYLSTAIQSLKRVDADAVQQLADDILDAHANDQTIFLFGNGGSGTTSTHLAQDLGKTTIVERPGLDSQRLKVISLADNVAYLLAWANDCSFECIFLEQLKNLARPHDLLIAFSGSGNSVNVLNAVEWANENEIITWGMTGFDGGALQSLAQRNLHVPADEMGQVESIHLLLFHWIILDVAERMRGRVAGAMTLM